MSKSEQVSSPDSTSEQNPVEDTGISREVWVSMALAAATKSLRSEGNASAVPDLNRESD